MTYVIETPAGPADHVPFVDVHAAVVWEHEHVAEYGWLRADPHAEEET